MRPDDQKVSALYALYSDPEAAQRAFNSLRGAGIGVGKIAAISSEPFDEYEFGRTHASTPMPWLAALGGLLGGVGGYLLAALTQEAYPLPTGGMPIVTNWTNGIITYELIMLGAILTTVLTWLVGARLPNWFRELYDPEVSRGKILIGVVNPPQELRPELEKRFRDAGAPEVIEFSKARRRNP
jgi:ActD protein